VKAHQDDNASFSKLSRNAQLNCICDHAAKTRIFIDGIEKKTECRLFPLESVGVFVDNQKMTSDTEEYIQFWAHRQLARQYFHDQKILSTEQFDQVDWKSVHSTLHGLPCLFQLWASKHVLGVAGTMKFLSYQDSRSPLCPSCGICNESCLHVAGCTEEGRTDAFVQSTQVVEQWLTDNDTPPDLAHLRKHYMSRLCQQPSPATNLHQLCKITRYYRVGCVRHGNDLEHNSPPV
jgi:hypothetical protein